MSMYKPWRSPPPAAKDEFDCVWCEGETETLNLRVYITEPDEDESGPIPSEAQLVWVWTGDMGLEPKDLNKSFVEKLEVHAMKVFTGEIKMAEAEYRIAKFEECAA